MAACIVTLPVVGVLRRFRWAAILSGLVLLECGELAVNGGRCPLTDLAARFTNDRAPNFDIYLPNWLAQHNKVIFGLLFVAGELVVLGYWLAEDVPRRMSPRLSNCGSSRVGPDSKNRQPPPLCRKTA